MKEYIVSPVKGRIIRLEDVPDEMFAKKMLGDGVAIEPESTEWFVPIDGVITMIYDTKHAIGITTDQGTELLLHIGLETYDLKGEPFQMNVQLNERVRAGSALMQVDLAKIKEKGYMTIAPIIATNKTIQHQKFGGNVEAGEIIFEIEE